MTTPSSTGGRPRRNAGWAYEDRVDAAAAGGTVLTFYAGRYRHSTAPAWRARIEAGQVHRRRADGGDTGAPGEAGWEVVGPEALLLAGDRLRYERPPWDEPPAPRSFAVLYEDDGVLGVAKPSGLQVLPAASFLENTLLHAVRQKRGSRWAPAHRLGRGTSGIVLFAGSGAARRRLAADFRGGGVRKVYRALVRGVPDTVTFEVEAPIGRLAHPGLGHVWAAVEAGKASRSRVRVLEARPADGASLVEVEIPTGRPHQIRIHLAWAGYPLVGEPLYTVGGQPRFAAADGGPEVPSAAEADARGDVSHGGSSSEAAARPPLPGDLGYLLHAARVTFTHPVSAAAVEVDCQPPPPLRRAGEPGHVAPGAKG